ncbi:IclR family transcriptional regulator [Glycomyces sp. NRRL B-16210]|uniref:IclR family transcriptional regulator n=1 Tax=Glycomyces sp. NRRL B-16210 TaxID=1463821 RepID=UPI00068A9039|nr:IclR family transcriptional regulator [Glycomyces sp. NRRL B-16210]
MSDPESSPRGVTAKLIVLLRELALHREPVGVSQLSRRTRLPKTTVHRLLSDLEVHGIVHRAERRYQLAAAGGWEEPDAPGAARLRQVLKPFALELYGRVGHVVALATADGDTARFLELLHPHRYTDVLHRIGGSVPLHCTAAGKALLAFDPAAAERYLREAALVRLTRHSIGSRSALDAAIAETRLRGIALEREEHLLGFWGAAAPVTGVNGQAVAAIGLAGPVRGFQPAEHLAQLRHIAKRASEALQH